MGCFQFETAEHSTALNAHLFMPLYKFLCAEYVDLEIELFGQASDLNKLHFKMWQELELMFCHLNKNWSSPNVENAGNLKLQNERSVFMLFWPSQCFSLKFSICKMGLFIFA